MPEALNGKQQVELSETAQQAIGFVLGYQPYECYDAAPRILAVLLREGVPQDKCQLLTTPHNNHYWVTYNAKNYTTADMSNFRESPTTDEKSEMYTHEALTHAMQDTEEQFTSWIFDKSGEFKKLHDKFVSDLRNPIRS